MIAIAEHLEALEIPSDLARTKVREMLAERDPGYRIGDKPLSRGDHLSPSISRLILRRH